jgi:lipopolysaccharide transport system permease protein
MSDQILIIKPGRGWGGLNLGDIWRYRELLYFLTWRDIKVRYKQTTIGVGWAILQPLLTMVVFTVFFGKMAQIPSEGIPYPVFSYSGLLLWTYFSSSVSNSGNSLVNNTNLITKVYFPRTVIPLSSSLTGIVDYVIAMSILVVMMFLYGFFPKPRLLLLPLVFFLAFISATGFGLWLSALNVKYRDVRYVIPFFIQLLLFATPVIYPATILPERSRWLLFLNPISGIIDAHRALTLGHRPIDWCALFVSSTIGFLVFITGIFYFRRTERFFADVI